MKSKIVSLCRYRVIYISISIILIQLILGNLWYIIFVPLYLIYTMKVHKDLMIMILIISSIYIVNYQIQIKTELKYAAQYDVVVNKVKQGEDFTSFEGRIDRNMVSVYLSDKTQIIPGELYTIKSQPRSPINQTVPGSFSYRKYLLSRGIKYQFAPEDITYQKTIFSVHKITYDINQYIEENIPHSKSYIKTFVLADKSDFDQNTLDDINMLGISHLFAVSGLHVGLLVLALEYLIKSIRFIAKYTQFIVITILILYMIITSFSPSVVRASMMYILLVVNKRFGIGFSTIDVLSIVFLIITMINPFSFYNPGFVLSFLVTYVLILNSDILRRYKGVHLIFMVGYLSFLSTIPIILSLNYQINLYTLIFNIIFLLYMTYIILPLSYITFLFTYFDKILSFFIGLYENLITFFAKIDLFIIKGNFQYAWQVIIFYIFIYFYMATFNRDNYRKMLTIPLLLILFLFTNFNYFTPFSKVAFLDVRGDAIVISDKFNRCNILIDTGEEDDYNSVINYLMYHNIKRIDYLIISHFHSDHFGEFEDLTETLKVRNIVTPDNVTAFYNKNIICGEIQLQVYQMSNHDLNENNKSIMMSVLFENMHYLFTGDAEKVREFEFINKYNVDVDYLKVAHHGSHTSSSNEFLNAVKPEEAFVIAYRYNMFDHPNEEVMHLYKSRNIEVHRTDLHGTIEVIYFLGKEEKKYTMP